MDLPANLPDASLAIELRTPITVKGGTIATLLLRQPTATEMWVAEGLLQKNPGPEGVTLYLRQIVASVSGCRPEDLEDVRIGDLNRCADYLVQFVAAGMPKDGESFAEPDEPSWELPLDHPVTFQGREYATLSLGEPTTGAIRKAQGQFRNGSGPQAARAYQMHLVTNTAGVPYAVVGQLPVSTLNAAATFIQGFSSAGRTTGNS